jgi:hypothetical protein
MEEIKEEAERIIQLFKRHHIILTSNSRGKPCSPYTSGLVGNDTIEKQAINFALIYCEGIIKEFPVNGGFDGVLDNMFKYFINGKRQYWQQVKEYIQNNY